MSQVHFHKSWMSGRQVNVNQSRPIFWTPVPPRTAVSIGNMSVSVISSDDDGVPFRRAGWYECRGYLIRQNFPLTSSLSAATPEQIWDDWVPKVDPVNFDVNTSFGADERFQSLSEGTGPDTGLLSDSVAGGDDGEGDVQASQLLSHPAVMNQIDWLGLGPTQVFSRQVPLGVVHGRGLPVEKNKQRYLDEFDISMDMKGSHDGFAALIFGLSIPELGAMDAGGHDEVDEPLAPWDTWEDMWLMFQKAPLDFIESVDTADGGSEEFKELLEWKRTYSVGDDTWHNTNLTVFVRGQLTLTTDVTLMRKHI